MKAERGEDVLARIQRLEDIEAIKEVKARYGQAADPTMNVDEMMSLFAEDAVLDIERFSVSEGTAEIRQFMAERGFLWMFHCMIPLFVKVSEDGRTARGGWKLWELGTMKDEQTGEPEAVWIGGVYDDEFVKENGEWKFKKVKLKMDLISPYSEGWAKKRFAF